MWLMSENVVYISLFYVKLQYISNKAKNWDNLQIHVVPIWVLGKQSHLWSYFPVSAEMKTK